MFSDSKNGGLGMKMDVKPMTDRALVKNIEHRKGFSNVI